MYSQMIKTTFLVLAMAFATVISAQGDPINQPPPLGAILDLSGTPIPGGGDGTTLQLYTVDFAATLANTDFTFAFREDPAFISFESASVVDLTTASGNLLTNGDFSGGTYLVGGNPEPLGWIYANIFGATFGGVVASDGTCANGAGTPFCYYDGAVQAYDAISQSIPTTIGDLYRISFSVADNSGCGTNGGPPCNFSDLSTNGDITGTGGNGINVTAYALAGLPHAAPEPASLLILGTGLLGLAAFARRRFRK
jgi:hypothetical protein